MICAIGVALSVLIIETPIFTTRLQQVLDDEGYRLLQTGLIASPNMGQVIPGSGGIRKLRLVGQWPRQTRRGADHLPLVPGLRSAADVVRFLEERAG
jgi:hypothetical protein